MKKIQHSTAILLLVTALALCTASCKKTVEPTASLNGNQVSIRLNGTEQNIDSLVVKPRTIYSKIVSIDIFCYMGHGAGGSFAISLLFAPSADGYVAGTQLSLSNGDAEIYYMAENSTEYDDNPFVYPVVGPSPLGSIVLTKNDVTARRMEGTVKGCVLPRVTGAGASTVTIDGNFAVSY